MITGGTWDSSQITVGSGGTGTLTISGGTVADNGATFGAQAGSSGTATITGGTWNNLSLYVGASGDGTLNIAGGVVTVHLDGYRTEVQVGNAGTGTLNINGGRLESDNGVLGYWQGATGTAMVTSGVWNNSGDLHVGWFGNGTLNINGGLVTDSVGYIAGHAGGTGVVTVSSGTWNNTDYWGLYVSNSTLNLTDAGVVTVGNGSGNLLLGGGAGTLNLGLGGTAGTLNAGAIIGSSEGGVPAVNFNHTGSYTFAPVLDGNLEVHKRGDGTTILTGNNSYTGQTFVEQGILQIDGHSGLLNIFGLQGAINVSSGAALTGNGLIERNVVVSEGGTMAGSLTIHGLVTLPDSFRQSVGDLSSGTAIADNEKVLMINHATGGSIDASAGSANIATLDGAALTTGNWGATVETLNSGEITTHGGSLVALAGDFTGSIGGSGCLIKIGSGLLTLETANFYTGGTVITGGTLEVRTNNAVNAVSTAGVLIFAGVLRIDEGVTLNAPVFLRGGGIEHGMAAGSPLKDAISATSHLEGGTDTTLQMLGGTISGATTLHTAFYTALDTTTATNDGSRRSDILSFNGTGSDVFVLQLSLASMNADSYLGWYNPATNAWVNAVDGNQAGTSNATAGELGFQGSFSSFQESYGSDINGYIGAWGTDVSGHAAWAVVNHNSSFAITSEAVPEPSEWAMLSAGAALLWVGNRRSKISIQ
jgi:autotransporter-associated beta strand protein/T5SS/PEP-CTERM-associated repeat protein